MTILNFNTAELPEQISAIPIGIRAENEVTQVALDFSTWAEELGAGVVQLLLKRAPDTAPYPVVLTQSGSTATWTVSATDLAYKGTLLAEWIYTIGTRVKKSVVLRFYVMTDIGVPGSAPDPYEDWLGQLTALAAQAQADAGAADQSASSAAASAAAAAGSSSAAAASASSAADSATSAASSANTATSKAGEAGQSATAAAGSASTSTIKAGEAAASAANAADSESAAARAASTAAGSARDAADSATAAAGSAASASGSAAAAADAADAFARTTVPAAVASVNSAGAAQVAEVQAKGAEVIASIPADYTELISEVDDIKSEISVDVVAFNYTEGKTLSNVSGSKGAIIDDANRCVSDKIPYTWTGATRYYTSGEAQSCLIAFYDSSDTCLQTFVCPNANSPFRMINAETSVTGTVAYVRFSFMKNYPAKISANNAYTYPTYYSAGSAEDKSINSRIDAFSQEGRVLSDLAKARLIDLFKKTAWASASAESFLELFCDAVKVDGWIDVKDSVTVNSSGAVVATSSVLQASDLLDVGEAASISGEFRDGLPADLWWAVRCYGSDKGYIGAATDSDGGYGISWGRILTLPSGTRYIRFLLGPNQTASSPASLKGTYTGRLLWITLTDQAENAVEKAYVLSEVDELP